MSNYAFIFARGGSKGLPRKNVKPLAGKPLLAYSIESALACPDIDRLFVSTEDAEIKRIALGYEQVEVIERPAELAKDTSAEWLAWQHAIGWVKEQYGAFDNFISLPVTSPLRNTQDIVRAISQRQQQAADICISVTASDRSPYFNMVTLDDNQKCQLVIPSEGPVTRRQDVPSVYDITTVVYAAKPSFIEHNHSLFSGTVTAIQVPKERAVDIDDIYDFYLAEAILKHQQEPDHESR
ncbi:N-acylneuraminate cytidylyltransferase [Saliniradius amylolyticus]|uniref:N-acylneuraminate cytidylyltransferase n=1 Tax=Saliniradius amylolyticus TaxID=2183582 RepID=A0A2S2E1U8_9ALTE|nr:acylneuraminate cytidylyltransferase family protein [Saliniradius amylolyticus]AWL11625.1 N-acylneuraminate cytidylyltransferase [Saliniradius amylolyticus]